MAFYSKWLNRKIQEERKTESVYTTVLGTEADYIANLSTMTSMGIFNKVVFESISTLHTCCKILSEDVGSFPIKIYKNEDDGSKTVIKDDYRYFLLHREPNGYTSHYDFFNTTEYRRNKTGNVFIKINRDRQGYIKSLTQAQPDEIDLSKYKIVNNKLFYFNKYEEGYVNAADYLHFKMLPEDGAYGVFGIDPLKPLSQNLGITYKALQTIDNFYENGAVTELMFETTIPEGISGADWIKSQEDFEAKHKGYSNAHKPTFLPPFTKPSRLPLNLTDAQFIDTIKFNANQICSFYKISPHLVGNFESSKFNNLRELQLGYKVNTLRPILRMYREELERKLLTQEEILDGYSIEFNSDALLETDAKERLEIYKGYMGIATMSPNMVCKNEGFPTFAGGDDHYMFNQYASLEKQNSKAVVPPKTPGDDAERGAPIGNQNAVKTGGSSSYMQSKAGYANHNESAAKQRYSDKMKTKISKSIGKKSTRQLEKTYRLMDAHNEELKKIVSKVSIKTQEKLMKKGVGGAELFKQKDELTYSDRKNAARYDVKFQAFKDVASKKLGSKRMEKLENNGVWYKEYQAKKASSGKK